MRSSSLIIKVFPSRIKNPLVQIANKLSAEYGRRVSLTEVVINACNAYIEWYRVERPEYLRAAVFEWSREHHLILEAVGRGCVNLEQIGIYVNRACPTSLNAEALQFLIEDLLGARKLKQVPQGKAGGEAHGNVAQMIFVKV